MTGVTSAGHDVVELLHALRQVHWTTAFRTYGSSHATLIGLLVDWWISADPTHRWALDGGPAYGPLKGGGVCDAIFGEDDLGLGVVEVEGTRYAQRLEQVGRYLRAERPDLRDLYFGIFLAYAYGIPGTRSPLPMRDFAKQACELTRDCPDKAVILVGVDKYLDPTARGLRIRNEYYRTSSYQVRGIVVTGGDVAAESLLAEVER